jgi:dTDP-4-dehydrorhamnose 3,5-epimerase
MKKEDLEGFLPTSIKNLLVKNLKYFPDFRGQFIKLFLNNSFVEEDAAISYRGVLRGLHYTLEGCRIFTPLFGRFYVVALDLQEGSQTLYEWVPFNVHEGNRQSFLIPPYVAFGYLVLSDVGIVHYKWQNKYDDSLERTVGYDDHTFNIYWPIKNPILSERDYFCDEKRIR